MVDVPLWRRLPAVSSLRRDLSYRTHNVHHIPLFIRTALCAAVVTAALAVPVLPAAKAGTTTTAAHAARQHKHHRHHKRHRGTVRKGSKAWQHALSGGYYGAGSAGGWSSYPGWLGWFQASDGHWYDIDELDYYLNGITEYAMYHYYEWNGYTGVFVGWCYHYNV